MCIRHRLRTWRRRTSGRRRTRLRLLGRGWRQRALDVRYAVAPVGIPTGGGQGQIHLTAGGKNVVSAGCLEADNDGLGNTRARASLV